MPELRINRCLIIGHHWVDALVRPTAEGYMVVVEVCDRPACRGRVSRVVQR